ncbi:protein TPX2 [Tanacetum coccineum]|uniref:rRNA N-glycosylase n=1 Tax=Tanacetum coccineum TaxID=301880 RepID=A0ABQ5AIH8_9ASTR
MSSVGRKSNAIFVIPGYRSTSSIGHKSNAIFALPGQGSTSSVGRKSNAIFALLGHGSTSSVGRKSNAIFAIPGHGSTSSVGHLDMGKQHDFGKDKAKPKKLPKQKSPSMGLVDKAKEPIEEVRSVGVGTSRLVSKKSNEAVGTSKPNLDDVMSLDVGIREGFESGISEVRRKMSNRTGSRFVEIRITLDGEEAFTLIIRRRALYLRRFRLRDGTTFEFGKFYIHTASSDFLLTNLDVPTLTDLKVCEEVPPTIKLDYDVDDMYKACNFKNWAENALALLQQSEIDLPYQMTVAYPSFKLLFLNGKCWELKVYILSTAKPTVSTAQVTASSTN